MLKETSANCGQYYKKYAAFCLLGDDYQSIQTRVDLGVLQF